MTRFSQRSLARHLRRLTIRCQWPTIAAVASWRVWAQWAAEKTVFDPWLTVTVVPETGSLKGLAVGVEFRFEFEGPYVVGIAVRRHVIAGYDGGRTDVSLRQLQRASLRPIVDAASSYAKTLFRAGSSTEGARVFRVDDALIKTLDAREPIHAAAAELTRPPGPKRKSSKPPTAWIAMKYRNAERKGRKPAQEIARLKGVPVNRVYQWIHEAKKVPHPEGLGPPAS
jgi:hypothetical protein